MVSAIIENGLDDELGYSKYNYKNKTTDNTGYSVGRKRICRLMKIMGIIPNTEIVEKCYISAFENGRALPNIKMIFKMAFIFNVKPESIIKKLYQPFRLPFNCSGLPSPILILYLYIF